MIYLVTDPDGRPLAGNIAAWPAGVPTHSAWLSFALERTINGQLETHPARGRLFVIPGGYRLLVGRDISDAAAFRSRVRSTLAVGRVDRARRRPDRRHGDEPQPAAARRAGEPDQRTGHGRKSVGPRSAARHERRVRPARRQSQPDARPDRTADDGDARGHRRRRPRSEDAAVAAAHPARTGVARSEPIRAGASQSEAIRAAIDEADRLLATFNALLSIAELESGARRDQTEPLDLSEIARSAAELYEPVAEEKGFALTVAAEPGVRIRGDRHLLSQALANLLDNALKYAGGGQIEIRVFRRRRAGGPRGSRSGPGHSRSGSARAYSTALSASNRAAPPPGTASG